MKEDSVGRIFRAGTWGAILGGAIGFALGLLFAPEEGKKVRRKLAYQLDHIGEQVADSIDRVLTGEEDSGAKSEGDALVADAEVKAEKIRNDIDALLGEMKQSQ